jgi:hypothetical protein
MLCVKICSYSVPEGTGPVSIFRRKRMEVPAEFDVTERSFLSGWKSVILRCRGL